jgi:hypothetical protein
LYTPHILSYGAEGWVIKDETKEAMNMGKHQEEEG